MAVYERFVVHRKVAAPIASEHHTIIEDCHGVLYNNSTNVAADEYYCSWPQKMITTTTRPPLPPPFHQGQHFYPQAKIHRMANYNEAHHDQQSRTLMQRPVNNVHRKTGTAILTSTEAAELYDGVVITELTSTEAAELYGGVVITEFGTRKHGRPN